jgi:dihydrofolate reductase
VIVSLIVAMDEKRGIGKDNQLPWHLPSDLKRFKSLTMGHFLIMGRKTFEAIGKPLKGRVTIVLTRKKDYKPPSCIIAHSLMEAIELAKASKETEVFIIGGGEIFRQANVLAEKIYLTRVHSDVDADVFFPEIDLRRWKSSPVDFQPPTDGEEFASEFVILTRNR